jgi:hypothetical protein
MEWRKLVLSYKLGPTAIETLKVKISMKRAFSSLNYMNFKVPGKTPPGIREKKFIYCKDYDSLGPRVDILFPLVTPDLDFIKRSNKHKDWYKHASAQCPSEFLMNDDHDLTVFEIVNLFPPVMPFVPTQKVLQKMILRAT